MQDLTGFQRDLLFVIAGLNEPSGLDVKDELEKRYGSNIRQGRLYPNLDTLVKQQLVEKGQKDQRTNKYVLSPAGKRTIRDYLSWELRYTPADVRTDLRALLDDFERTRTQ